MPIASRLMFVLEEHQDMYVNRLSKTQCNLKHVNHADIEKRSDMTTLISFQELELKETKSGAHTHMNKSDRDAIHANCQFLRLLLPTT